MLPKDTGVLVVGHGTRKVHGQAQLIQLVEHMRQLEPHWTIEPSFLELAEPTITQAIGSLKTHQIKRIIVVPILLFTAAHAKSDIPDEVQACAVKHGIEVVAQTPSLGTTPEVIRLSNYRFEEITSIATRMGCPLGHCGRGELKPCAESCPTLGKSYKRIALAMIGRGTSDPEALLHMRRFTELASSERRVEWVSTGFFAGGEPSVDGLLEQAASASCRDQACDAVVIQPHLLFEGELMDQLRTKIQRCQREYPDRQWILARCLGADRALAQVFVDFVRVLL
jgi:sirohydrochlorin cobaltochelatase